MFYPTGESTKGRTLVSIDDNNESLVLMEETEESFLIELNEWLEKNNYCVEKRELKHFMENCGFCSDEEIQEMEGGAPMDGGAFATLGSTPGMGDVSAPGPDGSIGSGDRFDSLTVGTNAAKSTKKKKRKKLRVLNDFDTFIKAMAVNQ